MKVWLVQDGEPIPGIDENTRALRTAMLAGALVARGHEVLWWASTFDHALKRHRFNTPRTIELRPGLKVRLLHGPGYSHNTSPQRFWHHRALAAAYAREIATCPPPDLVFCSIPTLELAEQSVLYGCSRQVPVVVDVRDAWPDLYVNLFPAPLRRLARPLLANEFRRAARILRAADGIIAVSDTYLAWARQYARRLSDNDAVFPIGYSYMPQNMGIEDDEEIFGLQQKIGVHPGSLIATFLGTFGSSYDLQTVIRSGARVSSVYPDLDVRIVIAGDGDQSAKLHHMSEGIETIVFTGWLDQQEASRLMRISCVGLASYASDAVQSLPNKPFEYMAAGLPLLSSLSGELEQLIADNKIGLQYKAGNVQSLTEKIVWLTENPEERTVMGKRARKLFEERFRADIIYPRLVTHLERVVSSGATTGSRESWR